MTINHTDNEANRLQELIDWRKERIGFWARFAMNTSKRAVAISRIRTRNLHAVELMKLEKRKA